MFKKCRSELEFLLSIVDGCPDPERDVANAISELDLAERRLQAAEKVIEAAKKVVSAYKGCEDKRATDYIPYLAITLADYRAATKEGK